MPLLLPDLDDRRWADLVDEGRALIPLFAPGWTDHNIHDPGITFMELFAGETELDLYRINRVPPSHVRKFLALVGAESRPPKAARTVLAFRLASGKPPRILPADLEIATEDLAGIRTVFRTLESVTVVELRLQAIQTGGPGGITDLSARWRRNETLFLFGDDPAPGAAVYLGFDQPLPIGVPVSLVFSLVPGGGAGARTVWEIQTRPGVWRRLEAHEAVDETRSLTASGRIVFKVPSGTPEMAAGRVGPVKENLFYLRCRLAGGAWDAPPELVQLAVNGVAAEQSESVQGTIGTGNGEPHQQLALPKAAVSEETLALSTNGEPWARRPDFDLSGRADSHFLLDATRGRVTFGDGENGRRLPAGAKVTVSYRATRAAEGNLPAGRVWKMADMTDIAEVSNPVPALGGAAAETLEEAAARAVDSVEQPLRAVTLADYERLALETPGVRLARAIPLANFDPAFPCYQATGVVTVIVLPHLPRRRPFPTPATRRAVALHLASRRLIGTRVIVTGPVYVEIAVRATVRSFPCTDPAEVRQRISSALDRFLHPLAWPLGRDVYRSEVLQVLDETPGVDHVLKLELIAAGTADRNAGCGNVCVGPTVLVVAGVHEINVEGRPA
jgi:hypothetical protein